MTSKQIFLKAYFEKPPDHTIAIKNNKYNTTFIRENTPNPALPLIYAFGMKDWIARSGAQCLPKIISKISRYLIPVELSLVRGK